MLVLTLRFQTLQLLLVPVNSIGWSGSGYIRVLWTGFLSEGSLSVFSACVRILIFVRFFSTPTRDWTMASFLIGWCSLGNSCLALTYELWKSCPGCNGLIHVLCGRVLEDDEGSFKADSVVCPRCVPQKQQQQGSGLFGKGLLLYFFSSFFCVLINYLLLLHCCQKNNISQSPHSSKNGSK